MCNACEKTRSGKSGNQRCEKYLLMAGFGCLNIACVSTKHTTGRASIYLGPTDILLLCNKEQWFEKKESHKKSSVRNGGSTSCSKLATCFFFAEEKCFFPIGNAFFYLSLILRLQKYEDLFWPAIEELLVKHREIFLMFWWVCLIKFGDTVFAKAGLCSCQDRVTAVIVSTSQKIHVDYILLWPCLFFV